MCHKCNEHKNRQIHFWISILLAQSGTKRLKMGNDFGPFNFKIPDASKGASIKRKQDPFRPCLTTHSLKLNALL